jgi:uncharacterized protein (DUF1697 family)
MAGIHSPFTIRHSLAMATHIALLRGVNVGDNALRMERLRALFAELGFSDARTYVQSGNVLFTASGPPAGLAAVIEGRLVRETRLPVCVLVRTPAQLKRIVAGNPFLKEPGIDPRKLHVTFLAGRAPKRCLALLGAVNSGADRWHAAGAEVYLHCPDGYGRSKLNNSAIERLLATRATTRNWNTVTALHEMSRD